MIVLVWWGVVPRFHGVDFLALAGILIGGFPIFKEAFADLFKGRMTMELSMTIALVAASAIGEFFTALLITVFVLIAEIIEGMTVGRGRGAIRQLLDLLPQSVEVRSDGQVAPRYHVEVSMSATLSWSGLADMSPWMAWLSAAILSSTRPTSLANRCQWKRFPARASLPEP